MQNQTMTAAVYSANGVRVTVPLIRSMCDRSVCKESSQDRIENPDFVFAENDQCSCGAKMHHYHCTNCGRVSQWG